MQNWNRQKKGFWKEKEGEKGGGDKIDLASAKPGSGVVSTHEGNTGALSSRPQQHQLFHSLNLHNLNLRSPDRSPIFSHPGFSFSDTFEGDLKST